MKPLGKKTWNPEIVIDSKKYWWWKLFKKKWFIWLFSLRKRLIDTDHFFLPQICHYVLMSFLCLCYLKQQSADSFFPGVNVTISFKYFLNCSCNCNFVQPGICIGIFFFFWYDSPQTCFSWTSLYLPPSLICRKEKTQTM